MVTPLPTTELLY